LAAIVLQNGGELRDRHHEIYLSDIRRAALRKLENNHPSTGRVPVAAGLAQAEACIRFFQCLEKMFPTLGNAGSESGAGLWLRIPMRSRFPFPGRRSTFKKKAPAVRPGLSGFKGRAVYFL
jgi:hypothetical protein